MLAVQEAPATVTTVLLSAGSNFVIALSCGLAKKISRHFLNQWEINQNQFWFAHTRFPAPCSDWLIWVSVPVVIGQNNDLGIRDSIIVTATLTLYV